MLRYIDIFDIPLYRFDIRYIESYRIGRLDIDFFRYIVTPKEWRQKSSINRDSVGLLVFNMRDILQMTCSSRQYIDNEIALHGSKH